MVLFHVIVLCSSVKENKTIEKMFFMIYFSCSVKAFFDGLA